jgi:hypothetical protein
VIEQALRIVGNVAIDPEREAAIIESGCVQLLCAHLASADAAASAAARAASVSAPCEPAGSADGRAAGRGIKRTMHAGRPSRPLRASVHSAARGRFSRAPLALARPPPHPLQSADSS